MENTHIRIALRLNVLEKRKQETPVVSRGDINKIQNKNIARKTP